MSKPSEHKTVQARILAYAQEIGWTLVTRAEAERRRGFESDATTAEERARRATLYFGGLLHGQLRAFNLQYQEAEGASIGQVATLAVQHRRESRFPFFNHVLLQLMTKTTIQAELPPELTARALTFVEEGWASDFNELLADALRRFLESHSTRVTESMVMSDVEWGLHGHD